MVVNALDLDRMAERLCNDMPKETKVQKNFRKILSSNSYDDVKDITFEDILEVIEHYQEAELILQTPSMKKLFENLKSAKNLRSKKKCLL